MKALITGGAGFLGLHLARFLLEKGWRVSLVDDFYRGVRDKDLEEVLRKAKASFHKIDLLETNGLEDFDMDYDLIFHFAAVVGVANVIEHPYEVLTRNYGLLEDVIRFARRQKSLQRLIFASSSEVYAGSLRYGGLKVPTPESSVLALTGLNEPRTSYMLSKIYGEAMCYHSGLIFTIVRPHNIFGPRMGLSHVIPEMIKKIYFAKEGEIIEVASPNHTRTFCYVDDAIELMYRLSTKDGGKNGTFNIGNNSPEIKIIDLVRMIVEVVGKKVKICPGRETPGSPERRCPEMRKTIAITSYKPKISLKRGIELSYRWYKEHIFASGQVSAK
jgi:nucleoside-diphosphate-sugar epimerase